MNTRILFAVVVSMFVCQLVHAQDDEPVMPEATELEGTWEVVSWVVKGEKIDYESYVWQIEGNRIVACVDEAVGHATMNITFFLDPSMMPAEVDTFSFSGIYELDGDSLTICIGSFRQRARPEVFESTEDYPTTLWILHRITEDDE